MAKAHLKKLVIGALILIMALVTACGNASNGGNSGGSQASGSNGGNAAGGSGSENKAKPKISIMTPLHTAETPDPKIEQLLEEKLNVELDIQWIPATTYVDRMSAAFATGSLTDVVNISMEGANKEAIRDGQF